MLPILNCITIVAAQSKLDAERFLALGFDPKKILITGNIKFDVKVPGGLFEHSKQLRLAWGKDRPIWIAASTHKGEEEKILVAAKIVHETIPESLLILVPRHPQRFNEVFDLCCKLGFEAIRYSENQKCLASTNVILGDVMGQLLLFYAVSNIAFVGGSFVSWGGHNLLEPAVLAKPIISGQHLNAFLEIGQLLTDAEALITVIDEVALARNLILLFQNKTLQEKLGCSALDVVEKHRGATKKILSYVKSFL